MGRDSVQPGTIGMISSLPCLFIFSDLCDVSPPLVVISWLGLQEKLPRATIKAVNKCKAVFMKKSAVDIDKEIEAFYLHHDNVLTWPRKMGEYKDSVRKVEEVWVGYIKEEMEKFEIML